MDTVKNQHQTLASLTKLTTQVQVGVASDGNGVVLAYPFVNHAQQHPAINLVARRLGHRLNCPVVVCPSAHGRAILDGALTQLHSRGVRSAVTVPLTFTQGITLTDSTFKQSPLRVFTAGPLGVGSETFTAIRETFESAEAHPQPNVMVVLAIAAADAEIAFTLQDFDANQHLPGWAGFTPWIVPTQAAQARAELTEIVSQFSEVLVMPLSLAPGPFVQAVWSTASALDVPCLSSTLHNAPSLTTALYKRVCEARRVMPRNFS